ncbi:atp3 gamma subunit of the F1 sector of mitochondrial F1F0 ATP synthase [Zygosaccharomyces mellis]|uniref:ATP synthase subunit gamma n=1 Tax=Zygosaccharomyces mellis TaxID=42258 RepID=A0A4C2E674_9SACH|nr:atp3 gamma subunit of the F1 sector of mitochondrial F1F0 ATP synthase [Zygosaccharomyces mellis]
MLSRIGVNAVRCGAMVPRIPQARNYATLKEVETRLKSIKNIEKITKTMKIVASTRLSRAERAKVTAKKFDEADSAFYSNAETKKVEEAETSAKDKGELVVAVSSDKGLCGSIHSALAKKIRSHLAESPNAAVVTVGDKMRTQLMRTHPDNVKIGINGIGKEAPTFKLSSAIADTLLGLGAQDYSKITIFFNNPVSSLSFEPTTKDVFNPEAIESSPSYSKFEIDNDGHVSQDLFEYTLSNKLLAALAEGYAAEISARRNAMDNASKNAGDMINKYSILYNRTRQAVITNELVDIITGASSLD